MYFNKLFINEFHGSAQGKICNKHILNGKKKSLFMEFVYIFILLFNNEETLKQHENSQMT